MLLRMRVFVDESGDTGLKFDQGSSAYLTIILVIFRDSDAAGAVDERIHALRTELHKPATFEFHFKENSDAIREAFLRAVASFDYLYTGMVVNKSHLYDAPDQTRASFYKDICAQVFEHAKPCLAEAHVKIDQSGGQSFRRELARHLKRQVNDPAVTAKPIKQVSTGDSKSDNLLQLADMICGAVARRQRTDKSAPDRFHKIIAHRELSVRSWPD